MANIPQKPVIENQIWINGQTKLNQTNLTNGVNQNITNLKTAVDGIIDALGGPGGESASDKTLDQSSISAYNPATTYSQGQVVIHDDASGVASYYRCNESGVTGTWDGSKWSKIALSTPVDSELDEDSTNPVQNKVVTAAINGLDGRLDAAEANVDKIFDDLAPEYSASSAYEVGDYCLHEGSLYKCAVKIASGEAWNAAHWEVANIGDDLKGKITLGSSWYDGTGGVRYADYANDLISETGLTVNDDPMSFGIVGGAQKSAVGDGNANLNKLVCVDVVRNQLVRNGNFVDTRIWEINDTSHLSLSVSGNVATLVHTTTKSDSIYQDIGNAVVGHKYLVLYEAYSNVENSYTGYAYGGVIVPTQFICSTNKKRFGQIFTATNTTPYFGIYAYNKATYYISNVLCIDLTKRYGNNDVVNAIIGTTASKQVANLLAFDPEILNYTDRDMGTIVPSKTAKLLPVGVNQWDEEPEFGYAYSTSNGAKVQVSGVFTSLNKIDVFENLQYYIQSNIGAVSVAYFGTNDNFLGAKTSFTGLFTTPVGCKYIRFNATGTTYNHNICINVSDPNINGKYYPSKRTPVNLPNYEGHGILKVVTDEQTGVTKVVADGTELYPDGNSKKRYGIVKLNTLTWQQQTAYSIHEYFSKSLNGVIKAPAQAYYRARIICSTLPVTIRSDSTANSGIAISTSGDVVVKMNSYAFTDNDVLVYELATEQDITTPIFQPTFPVEQNGTLQFLDENDNLIAGLQGNEILYAKSTNGAIQGLFNRLDIDWNPDNVVSATQFAGGIAKLVSDIEDGNVIPRLARDLTPYSDDSGKEQSNPVISQGTGTDNNTAIVTTGNFAQLREKQGKTLAVVQSAKALNATNWLANANANVSFDNGVATFTSIAQNGAILTRNIALEKGRRYLVSVQVKLTTATDKVYLRFASQNLVATILSTSWQTLSFLFIPSEGAIDATFAVRDERESDWDAVQVKDPVIFDVTSWPNVSTDLTAHPDHFPWYYNGSLAYNEGSLQNANGVKLVCTKRNLFNKASIVNGYLNQDGSVDSSQTSYKTSDFILLIPNKAVYIGRTDSSRMKFYDKNKNPLNTNQFDGGLGGSGGVFVLPSNAQYMRFSMGNNYVDSVDVSLYYTEQEGGEGYNQHYDYKEPTVVDTGSEVLRSARSSLKDYKEPNGTIHRLVGVVDLGTLNWIYESGRFRTNGISSLISDIEYNWITAKLYCARYRTTYYDNTNFPDKSICETGGNKLIHIKDSSYTDAATFKSAMSGVMLCYELATPTTEQGTPFPENIDIDDYGMMYWLDENDELVGIPQGAKFFYPVNYKGFIDDAYSYLGGDAQKIIRTYETDPDAIAENPHVNDNWDTAPTSGSTKPVTSGGIYEAISEITITEMTDEELLAVQNIITGN